jgi:hypothetical protein
MYIFSFEKLEVWKEAIQLSVEVYRVTKKFPKEKNLD